MEKFLEQSMEAEDNFYRLEEQRLQAEDKRREEEHSRELQMLQMLGQIFAGISTSSPATPQPSCIPQTNPTVPLMRPSFGNRNHPSALNEFASHSQPAGPGLLMEEGDAKCSSRVAIYFQLPIMKSKTVNLSNALLLKSMKRIVHPKMENLLLFFLVFFSALCSSVSSPYFNIKSIIIRNVSFFKKSPKKQQEEEFGLVFLFEHNGHIFHTLMMHTLRLKRLQKT